MKMYRYLLSHTCRILRFCIEMMIIRKKITFYTTAKPRKFDHQHSKKLHSYSLPFYSRENLYVSKCWNYVSCRMNY